MNELQATVLKQIINPDMLGDCELFMKAMLPEGCKEMQRLDMLTAYWAGASTFSVILMQAKVSRNVEAVNTAIEQISAQMEKYGNRLVDRVTEKLEAEK